MTRFELLPPMHRPHAEVLEMRELRMKEIEQQAAARDQAPPCEFPCAECKWLSGSFRCCEPLILGFDHDPEPNVDWQLSKGHYPAPNNWPNTQLCGREKHLWRSREEPPPALTRWQHLLKAIFG